MILLYRRVQRFIVRGITEEEMCGTYDNDVEKYTYMISPNKFCTEVFQSAFRINRERLIETGYPRNDFIVNITQKEIDLIKINWGSPVIKKLYCMRRRGEIMRLICRVILLICRWISTNGKKY